VGGDDLGVQPGGDARFGFEGLGQQGLGARGDRIVGFVGRRLIHRICR